MDNNIQIFSDPQFGDIRTIEYLGKPLFCATDICRALGYVNNRKAIDDHCDDGDVTKRYIRVVTGKKADGSDATQDVLTTFVNESGLYALILGCKLENAKKFKRWVTSEVLPAIRKTGAYIARNMTRKDIALMVIQQEEEMEVLRLENQRKQHQLEEQKPKVVFADAVVGSNTSCLIGEMAKIITQNGYEIGQNRLFAWMREHHYLGTVGEYYNIPCQKYLEQGLFELKKNVHSQNGQMITTITPKVTGKGQQYFINKFLNA